MEHEINENKLFIVLVLMLVIGIILGRWSVPETICQAGI